MDRTVSPFTSEIPAAWSARPIALPRWTECHVADERGELVDLDNPPQLSYLSLVWHAERPDIDDWIDWNDEDAPVPDDAPAVELATHPAKILPAFIRIARVRSNKAPAEVEVFARRFGPLFLCVHGALAGYHREELPGDNAGRAAWVRPNVCRPSQREPLDQWLVYARRAAALTDIIATLRNGKLPSLELWGDVSEADEWRVVQADERRGRSVADEWGSVAAHVNEWIEDSQARLSLTPQPAGPPTLTLGGTTAPAALAASLLQWVTDQGRRCDGCRGPYWRTNGRAPRSDKAALCETCRETRRRVAGAVRQGRHREKVKVSADRQGVK